MLQPADFTPGARMHGFTVKSTEPLSEIDGFAHVMIHEKSGARLVFLQNDDANKSFSISFKTPPADDTGVFHILEHSVLCGSQKFPVKEPFVNLLRTSMQTFLNAMTFPDKTMYPVATTNDQDLMNLMDVYMDAVLNPNIYAKRAIFEQEGWHYELDDATDDAPHERLRYNGVVFNEMKGALSDADDVLYQQVNAALFPDTCYAWESGGHPRAIPTLTYENYLDTHARHYRLDNSYIVLYGDVDADRVLAFLDERYLSRTEPRSSAAPNPIGVQAPVRVLDKVVPMETAPENATVGIGFVVGKACDFERVLATDVLIDVLMGSNESPIKHAILDAHLGGDASAFMADSQAQPFVLFQLKHANAGVATEFLELVQAEAARLVREGIPRDLLEASLAQLAFELRERDRGMADGIPLAMNVMASWLYDDDAPTTYLKFEEPLAHMRAGLDGRYFEELLESLVVSNPHLALVEVRPEATQGERAEAAELSAALAGMDEAAKQAVRDELAVLRELQEAPDTPEGLATLPRLRVSDIGAAKPDPRYTVVEGAPLPCLLHDMPTRHIAYLRLYFDCGHLTWDDLPYLTIMSMLLGRLGTACRDAAQLDVHTRSHLGSLHTLPEAFVDERNPDAIALKFIVSASAVCEELPYVASIPREVWETTSFNDPERVYAVLLQRRIGMEQSFANNGHTFAMNRLSAHQSSAGMLRDWMGGVSFYLFLKDLVDNFEERFEGLHQRLAELLGRVVASPSVIASFTGSQEDCRRFWECAGKLGLEGAASTMPAVPPARCFQIPAPLQGNEAFVVSSDVCFVAKGSNASELGAYSGIWPVACNALSFDYLWNEVRVKGGAYGTGFRRLPNGAARFYSYRDPGIDGTLERFDGAAAWMRDFNPEPEDMEGFIVSTVATHDAPVKPKQIAARQDAALFSCKPADHRERLREEILAATPDALRNCAAVLQHVADNGDVCVFGNEDIIEGAKIALEVTDLRN